MRGSTRVLHGVDLVVTPASRIAIVGENGRGKSTLLHVLFGSPVPDHGSITRVGTCGLAEQEFQVDGVRTAADPAASSTSI